jgi:uncharacterized protein (DUF58 family)
LILPLERWLPLFIVCIYLGVILQSPILIALPLSLLFILLLSAWWRNHSLDKLEYRRRFHYTRAFPGETSTVRIEVENNKILPLTWLRLEDPWPKAVGPTDADILAPSYNQEIGFLTQVFSLRWFERTRRRYELLFRERGVYSVGPARVSSGDLFGIYEQGGERGGIQHLTVFPAIIPHVYPGISPEYPIGDRRSRRRISEDPNQPMGVRDYHPEDSFRRVHWPATARTGELQVKVFQPVSAQVMVLCLNISTHHRYWEGVYPELLEHLLSVAATVVYEGMQRGFRVGMISNGCLANSDQPFRIMPGRSPGQLAHLLSAIAGITPVVVAPFERLLLREIPRVPYGSSLLILTAITSSELSDTLLRLHKHERQITLLSLEKEAPVLIPGVRSIHMPFKEGSHHLK